MQNPIFDARPKAVDILVYAGDSFTFEVKFTDDNTPGDRFDWAAQVRGSAGDEVPDAEFDIVVQPHGVLVTLSPATTRKLWTLRAPSPDPDDFFYTPSDHLEHAVAATTSPALFTDVSLRKKHQESFPKKKGATSPKKKGATSKTKIRPDTLHQKVTGINQYLSLTPCGSEAFEVDHEVIGPLPPDWLPDVGLPTYPGSLARTSVLNHNYLGVWDLQLTDKAHGPTVTVARGRILVVSDVTRSEHQLSAQGTAYSQGLHGVKGDSSSAAFDPTALQQSLDAALLRITALEGKP